MLPLVNVFSSPYEAWETRTATPEEMKKHYEQSGEIGTHVNINLQARITNAVEAAIYMAKIGADNGLEIFIDNFLDNSQDFRKWEDKMLFPTPESLKDYQEKYPLYDLQSVAKDIELHGDFLSDGQMLFHGGLWPNYRSNTFKTNLPFSTTFCPQVALRNAEHKGKAYDQKRIDLFVLRATSPTTKVFSFRRNGTDMGHEKEVLFAPGATLTLRSKYKVRDDFSAFKYGLNSINIPAFVLDIIIS